MDPRLEAKLAAHQATIRELERTGQYDNPNIDRQAIMSALMDGPQDAHQQQQLAHFANMVEIGHPDTNMEALDDPNTKWDETPAPFGMNAQDLRKSMLDGYEGRGWSQSDQEALGRAPKSRELSPGSRQFQEIDRRKTFLKGLIDSHGSPEEEPNTHGHITPSSKVSDTSFGPPRVSKEAVRDRAVKEFDRTRGQKFGESGWVGHMENPEYLTGRVMNNFLDDTMRKYQYMAHDGDSYSEAMAHAKELKEAQAAGNAVSPMLSGNYQNWEEKEAAYKRTSSMDDRMLPVTRDYAVRKQTGQYPSFAESKGTEFLENLLDPPTMLAAISTGGATMLPSMASAASKATKAVTSIPRAAAIYTKNLGRTGKALSKAGSTVGAVTGPEEIPMYAGIQGGVYASTPELMETLPKNFFHSGNTARTDLYAQGPDGNLREESQSEFLDTYAKKVAEKHQAQAQLESWKRNTPKSPYAK
jgi:hypothetical protein